jgi:hypothetical protein
MANKVVESVDRIKQLYAKKCDEAANESIAAASEYFAGQRFSDFEKKTRRRAAAAKRHFNKIVDALVPGDLIKFNDWQSREI